MGKQYFCLMLSPFGTILRVFGRTLIASGDPLKAVFNNRFSLSLSQSDTGCFLPHILVASGMKQIFCISKPLGYSTLYQETEHKVDPTDDRVLEASLAGNTKVTLKRGTYVRAYMSGEKETHEAWIITDIVGSLASSSLVVPIYDNNGGYVDPIEYLRALNAYVGEVKDLMDAEKRSIVH